MININEPLADGQKDDGRVINQETQALKDVGPDFLELFSRSERVIGLAASKMTGERDPNKAQEKIRAERVMFLEKKRAEIEKRPALIDKAKNIGVANPVLGYRHEPPLEYFIESHLSPVRMQFDFELVTRLLSTEMKEKAAGISYEPTLNVRETLLDQIRNIEAAFSELMIRLKQNNEGAFKLLSSKIESKCKERKNMGRELFFDLALGFVGGGSYANQIREILLDLEEKPNYRSSAVDKMTKITKNSQSWIEGTMNKKNREIRRLIAKKMEQVGKNQLTVVSPLVLTAFDRESVLSAIKGYEEIFEVSGSGNLVFVKTRQISSQD